MQFEFYVLNLDFNKNKIINYNIFNNIIVQERTEKVAKKYLRNLKKFSYTPFAKDEEIIYGFNALVREIDSIIAWQEKGRREYECSVGDAFTTDCENLEKIDCWYQAHANVETITHDVIRQYKEQLKREDVKRSKEFVREFNKNKVTEEFLESCKKAGKLFGER